MRAVIGTLNRQLRWHGLLQPVGRTNSTLHLPSTDDAPAPASTTSAESEFTTETADSEKSTQTTTGLYYNRVSVELLAMLLTGHKSWYVT